MWRTHGVIGISLKRHQRWRLLLWQRGKANNTSRAPWYQWWCQNHIILMQCCRKPLQRGSHGNWWKRKHTRRHHSYQRTSSHSHGSRDLRHNELQERYIKMHNRHPSNQSSKKQPTEWEQWMYWQTPKCLTDVVMLPDPNIWHVSPISHADTPEHIQMYMGTWGHTDMWGCQTYGGVQMYGSHLNIWGPHPHITCRYPLEHTDAQGRMGTYGGVWMYWGCTNIQGVYRCPQV